MRAFDPQRRMLSVVDALVANWLKVRGTGGATIKSIQRGTITIAASSSTGTASITAVVVANSFIISLGSSGLFNGQWSDNLAEFSFTSTLVTATRAGVGGAGLTSSFEIIEYESNVVKTIQSFSVAIAGGTTSNTTTITAVNTAKSYIIPRGSKSTDTGGNGPDGLGYLRLTNSTTITGTRAGTIGTLTLPGTVIEFN